MVKMNKPSESSYGINVEDRFDPTDDHVVALSEMDEYHGVSKIDGKAYTSIVWKFLVYDEAGVAYTNLIDGGPFETWQYTSMSLSTKSNGRAWASALLGHDLTDQECDKIADAFDEALVGKKALASWKIEEDANGNKRLKIVLLRPLKPARAARPAAQPARPQAPTVTTGSSTATVVTTPSAPQRETPAERRARLEAELAAVEDDDSDDGRPF